MNKKSSHQLPHQDKEIFELTGHELNKIIVIMDSFLKMKPSLNERVMPFFAYLCDMNPVKKELDEIVWELGMTLPSWEDK